ncbi:MAG: amidohydrolase family protein [Clostridia bacterium]|nr:amidohydrolase family protein [Clostridia bacterium]
MEKVYDAHVHHLMEVPIDDAIEIFKEDFEWQGMEKYIFLAISHETNTDNTQVLTFHLQNAKCLFLKREFSPNAYAFASLVHPDDYSDPDAVAEDFLRQTKEYMSAGFDGIKMLEGYPSLLKLRKIPLDSPMFDKFYAYCEENAIPITSHIANPKDNWDPALVSEYNVSVGRAYDDTYPTKEEITEQTFRVLEKYPRLRLSLAHCGFLTYDISEMERFLSFENTIADITPGGEQLFNMAAEWDKWLPLIEKYQDRFVYGTDFYAFQRKPDGSVSHNGRPVFLRQFFETDEEHTYITETFRGVKLDKSLRDKIYRENFARLYPEPKKVDDKWLVNEVERVYREKKFRFRLEERDCEYILGKVKQSVSDK